MFSGLRSRWTTPLAWTAASPSATAAPISAARCQPMPSERIALPQVLALEQFGDRVGEASVASEILDLEDIGVVELGDRLGLALESFEPVGVVRYRLREAP